jgi:hypothetical protein
MTRSIPDVQVCEDDASARRVVAREIARLEAELRSDRRFRPFKILLACAVSLFPPLAGLFTFHLGGFLCGLVAAGFIASHSIWSRWVSNPRQNLHAHLDWLRGDISQNERDRIYADHPSPGSDLAIGLVCFVAGVAAIFFLNRR